MLGILMHDRREMLHLEALRVEFADGFDVGHDVVQVDARQVEEQFFSSHVTNLPTMRIDEFPLDLQT
jgi:hypothetical protein